MKDEWEAFSDKARRDIIKLLKKRPHTAGEIADQFELSAATVSHHLSVLKRHELIFADKRKQTIIYSLNANAVKKFRLEAKDLF